MRQGRVFENPLQLRIILAPGHNRFLLVPALFEWNLGNRLGKFPPQAGRKRRLTCVGSRRAFGIVWPWVEC